MDKYVTGAVIRRLREKKNLTQEELAQKVFVSSKTVSKVFFFWNIPPSFAG